MDMEKLKNVLVPFSGFLYLYDDPLDVCPMCAAFSSPSRGSYISTKVGDIMSFTLKSSRPLLGVLISLLYIDILRKDL